MLLDARKVGRPPSDNPKATKLTVRIDAEETKILDKEPMVSVKGYAD